MEDVFNRIYRGREWQEGSGPGSYPEVTRPYRYLIEQFIEFNDIRSIVDFGCGDWQSSQYINWGGANYMGLDCVGEVIAENVTRFQKGLVRFLKCDIFECGDLPTAELAIVKDVLQHWTHQDIIDFIPKLSRYRYVLFTNCRTCRNVDIGIRGPFHPVNMGAFPFELPVVTLLHWSTKATQLWQPS